MQCSAVDDSCAAWCAPPFIQALSKPPPKPRKRPQRAVLQEIIADFWPVCNHFAQFSCISSPEDRACSLAIQPKSHYNITYHCNLYYKRIIRRVYDLSGLFRQYPGRRSGFATLLRSRAQLPGQCKFPPCSRHCRKGCHRCCHPEHCPQSECAARRDHLYIRCQRSQQLCHQEHRPAGAPPWQTHYFHAAGAFLGERQSDRLAGAGL